MKALTTNLATRPFRNNTIIGSIVAGVAAALLIATIYNLYIFLSYGSSYALLLDDRDRNRAKLEELDVEERALVKQIEARDFATAFEQGSVANELILKRTFSWTELFNKLEKLVPAEVMMSAIRPNVTASAIVIRVEGVAKTHLAFLSLQENLLAHDSFSEVYPGSIRRINPSRPEFTFILNFNYRQSERAPAGTVVAESEGAPPGEPPGEVAASGTADESAMLRDDVLRAAAEADILPVGRDGRPRTLEVIARRMVAPGGVYVPSQAQPVGATDGARPRGSGQRAGAAQPAVRQTATGETGVAPSGSTSQAARRAGSVSAASATAAASAGAALGSGGEGDDAAGAPAAANRPGATTEPSTAPGSDAIPATRERATTPPEVARQLQLRRPGGKPARARTGTADSAPAAAGPAEAAPGATQEAVAAPADAGSTRPPAPADLDLNFVARPVGDLYRTLGLAHGVRFVIDAGIDGNATLTVDLTGMPLQEAIATMEQLAGQRITEVRSGQYQVVAVSGGEPLLDPPVEEENLPAAEGPP